MRAEEQTQSPIVISRSFARVRKGGRFVSAAAASPTRAAAARSQRGGRTGTVHVSMARARDAPTSS